MKKVFGLICIVVMALCLVGCGKSIQEAKVGDIVEFGRYEHIKEEIDGKLFEQSPDPIKWYIIDIDEINKRKLAICKTAISDIILDDFLLKSETKGSYQMNMLVKLIWYDAKIFNATEQKQKCGPMFLLDAAQVKKYLTKEMRVCKLTSLLEDQLNAIPKDSDLYSIGVESCLKNHSIGWWIKPNNVEEIRKIFPYVSYEGKIREDGRYGNFKYAMDVGRNIRNVFEHMDFLYDNGIPLVIRPAVWIKYGN